MPIFTSPFPPDVLFTWAEQGGQLPPLAPGEQALLGAGATEKRVRAFTLGRHCAREALRMLAQPDQSLEDSRNTDQAMPAVLRGEGRAPLWPEGIVGAITHTGNYAAAAAASSQRYLGLGLDLERIGRGMPRLGERILRPEERKLLKTAPQAEQSWRTTTIFSAKESIYKALNPVTGIYLGFQDATVTLRGSKNNHAGSFTWMLLKDCATALTPALTPALKPGFTGQGAYERRDNLVLTAVWVTIEELK